MGNRDACAVTCKLYLPPMENLLQPHGEFHTSSSLCLHWGSPQGPSAPRQPWRLLRGWAGGLLDPRSVPICSHPWVISL